MSILAMMIILMMIVAPAFSFKSISTRLQMSTDKIMLEIKKADSLFIIPALTVPLFEIEKLRGVMTNKKMVTVSKDKLLMSIDGTPFCQAADFITDMSNICVIGSEGETDDIMDAYMLWTRKLKAPPGYDKHRSGFLVCRRTHMVKVSLYDNPPL